MLRSTSATGSTRRGKNLVVMKTSWRGTPLSRNACPTLSSLPYACAVSMCRYPSSSAHWTAATHSGPFGICHTPGPINGIALPSASTRPRPSAVIKSIDIALVITPAPGADPEPWLDSRLRPPDG